jgi:pimeloyl-CoA synthetase
MKQCPKVCSDIPLNLKNRDWAFANVGYGPANPDSPEDFWQIRAKEWNTSEKNAQTMHCGNCSAFIQTPEMMECIVGGIQGEESDDETYANEVVASAELGYCELFEFKCAADRTCSAWLFGGPINTAMTDRQKTMLKMAKLEYETNDDTNDMEQS